MSFLGYVRPDGSVGIRNEVLVIPGGLIASKVCEFVPGTRSIVLADNGSGRTRRDRETIARTYLGLALNPNAAAVIVHTGGIGSDYPELKADIIVEAVEQSGKPVVLIDVAKEGGILSTIQSAIAQARVMVREASQLRRSTCEDRQLCIGVKCGASDPTSGLAGNPVIGLVYDRLIAAGGTAMFGETTEIIGAEHLLAKRAASQEVAAAIVKAALRVEDMAKASGEDIRTVNPIPANIKAGISTLEEKSLGAISKSGSAPIESVLRYAERPTSKGLHFVDNWMTFNSIFTGYAASGATLLVLQLGGGGMTSWQPMEAPPTAGTPLLSGTANAQSWAWSEDNLDFYSGGVIAGVESFEEAADRLYHLMLETASGSLTKSETVRYEGPAQVYTSEPAF